MWRYWKIGLVVLLFALCYSFFVDTRPVRFILLHTFYKGASKYLLRIPDEDDPTFVSVFTKVYQAMDTNTALLDHCKEVNITLKSGIETFGIFCNLKHDNTKLRPVLYHISVGGWMMSQPRMLSTALSSSGIFDDMIVFTVEIRVAPYRYPDINNDVYEGLLWLMENGEKFGVDTKKIVLSGASAGGHLTASTTLKARDNNIDNVVGQILLYPATDLSPGWENRESVKLYGEGYVLSARAIVIAKEGYIPKFSDIPPEEIPYASPLSARDFTNLPPALVILGKYDVLHDEGLAYSQKLKEGGNQVEVVDIFDTHGGVFMARWLFGHEAEQIDNAMKNFVKKLQKMNKI